MCVCHSVKGKRMLRGRGCTDGESVDCMDSVGRRGGSAHQAGHPRRHWNVKRTQGLIPGPRLVKIWPPCTISEDADSMYMIGTTVFFQLLTAFFERMPSITSSSGLDPPFFARTASFCICGHRTRGTLLMHAGGRMSRGHGERKRCRTARIVGIVVFKIVDHPDDERATWTLGNTLSTRQLRLHRFPR